MAAHSFSILAPPPSPCGAVIPSDTPHAVSVSLPTWKDNVDYEEGHPRIAKAMKSGYPRFYIHHLIDRLAQLTTAKYGRKGELCILTPSRMTGESCCAFLASRSPTVPSRLVEYAIEARQPSPEEEESEKEHQCTITLYACFFAAENFSIAKQFWQHTGDGISSRVAERCLIMLGELEADGSEVVHVTSPVVNGSSGISSRYGSKTGRYATKTTTPPSIDTIILPPTITSKSRYATNSLPRRTPSDCLPPSLDDAQADESILTRYVEERYGRNLDLSLAPIAKLAMRRRIAGVLKESASSKGGEASEAESTRGVGGLTEKDVWLYTTGMGAIFHAHQLAMAACERDGRVVGDSVCFGFPYTDTLKILQKWGPGCQFFGRGLTADIPALRALLESTSTPILALFCEFPSNPLLRTPPLKELRVLANEFGFLIIIDETIAGFVNVEVLPDADIVVSSLTKVFSGDSNVMGGSLVINPKSPFYASLFAAQTATYEDTYFDEDAIYMERNSRDFQERIRRENRNAEMLCTILRERRSTGPLAEGMTPTLSTSSSTCVSTPSRPLVIKEVYYPKYMTPTHYLTYLRPSPSDSFLTGFGGLFSLTFTSQLASEVFFDNLPCYKGPSLGTNFTLACPYTVLAHYTEFDWAKEWGVEQGLVRISTGLEDEELLKEWFEKALSAAEEAVGRVQGGV